MGFDDLEKRNMIDVGDRTIKQEYLDNVLEPFMPCFELEEEIGFKTVEKIKDEPNLVGHLKFKKKNNV